MKLEDKKQPDRLERLLALSHRIVGEERAEELRKQHKPEPIEKPKPEHHEERY